MINKKLPVGNTKKVKCFHSEDNKFNKNLTLKSKRKKFNGTVYVMIIF